MIDAQLRPSSNDDTAAAQASERVPVGSAVYNRVLEYLYEEASLLDQLRLKEWAVRLAQDLVYVAPLRHTRNIEQQSATLVHSVQHYHDDWRSIMVRIARLTGTKSAWAEDPPSR